MRCRDIEDQIICYASGAATPPEVAAHIAGCERCRRLARAMSEARQVAPPTPAQLQTIAGTLLADLTPVKPLPPAGLLLSAFVISLVIIALFGAATLGIAGWRALSLLQRTVVFTALPAAAAILALSASRQIVPGSRVLLSAYMLVIMVFGVLIGIFVTLFSPQTESAFVSSGVLCLGIGVEFAIPAAVLLWLVMRRGAILSPIATGATAGALAGLGGLTVLELHCPNLNEYHILVWHLGAMLASAIAGLAIGIMVEYFGRTLVGAGRSPVPGGQP